MSSQALFAISTNKSNHLKIFSGRSHTSSSSPCELSTDSSELPSSTGVFQNNEGGFTVVVV